MAAPKGTYGQPMQKAQRLMKDLTKKEDGLSQLAAVSQSPNLPNGTALAPVKFSTGRLLRTTVFKTSGTWNKKSDVGLINVTVVAGGGGGGGVLGGSSIGVGAGGGGGGGAATLTLQGSNLSRISRVVVTVGSGGTAGAATPTSGGTGVTSSFGSYCVATGGLGGSFYSGVNTVLGSSGQGGIGTVGDLLLLGDAGGKPSLTYSSSGSSGHGGSGASQYGGGGAPSQSAITATSAAGVSAGANTGGGGSGAAARYNTADARAGGAGGSGIVIVEEYSK